MQTGEVRHEEIIHHPLDILGQKIEDRQSGRETDGLQMSHSPVTLGHTVL